MSTAYLMRGYGCHGSDEAADPESTSPFKSRWHRWLYGFRRFWRRRCATHPTQRLVERVAQQLALDDSQRTALVHLLSTFTVWRADLFRERVQFGANMRTLLAAARLDQSAMLEHVQEATRAIDKRSETLIGAFAEFSDSLNEPQRQKMLTWMDRWLGDVR